MSNRSDDESLIDRCIHAFFAAFDNRAGAIPELARILGCFTEDARIVHYVGGVAHAMSPPEFATPRITRLVDGSLLEFHEYETAHRTEVFGGIAERVSSYRKQGVVDGTTYSGTGTKCFHLVRLDADWRIASLLWIDDAP